MGRIIPYIMENKKCLKPPTRIYYNYNAQQNNQHQQDSAVWGFHVDAMTHSMDSTVKVDTLGPGRTACSKVSYQQDNVRHEVPPQNLSIKPEISDQDENHHVHPRCTWRYLEHLAVVISCQKNRGPWFVSTWPHHRYNLTTSILYTNKWW